MLRAWSHYLLGAGVSVAMSNAWAIGFAATSTTTTLGQTLNFAAVVTLDGDELLTRECVAAEVMAGDAMVSPGQVRVTVEAAANAGQRIVRVSTAAAIEEPVVTVSISLGCASRVTRKFVAFVDPPNFRLAQSSADAATATAAAAASMSMAPSRETTSPSNAAGAAALRPRRLAKSPRRHVEETTTVAMQPAERLRGATGRGADADKKEEREDRGPRVARSGASSRLARAAAATGAPRLSLEPPVPPAPTAPTAPTSSPAASAPAQTEPATVASAAPAGSDAALAPSVPLAVQASAGMTAASAASDALEVERARIRVLEAGLIELRNESRNNRQSMLALQARLREAEGERYANPLVYGLALLALAMLLVIARLWRQRATGPQQRWFDAAKRPTARPSASKSGSGSPSESAPASPPAPSTLPGAAAADRTGVVVPAGESPFQEAPVYREAPATLPARLSVPDSIGGLEVTTVLAPSSMIRRDGANDSGGYASIGARREGESSIEELIDLEQQAEFFIVLGQDEAAIDLLVTHLRNNGSASPWPYLKLLEMYQRRGEQGAYEQTRTAFNERFQAFAPDWNSDIHFGRSLEDYPQIVARLQALWPTPMHAMQTLHGLLYRRSEDATTFDFPAYRELLFLYSIAREISENVETDFGAIDLFLPLETPGDDAAEPVWQSAGSTAPSPLAAAAAEGHAVDLDISGWPEDMSAGDLVIRKSPGRRGAGG